MFKSTQRLFALLLAVSALLTSLTLAEAKSPVSSKPMVVKGACQSGPIVPYIFKGDMRNLPKAPEWQSGDPIKEIPKRNYHQATNLKEEGPMISPPESSPDHLLEFQEYAYTERISREFSTPILNFDGQRFTGVYPPDTVGDVGINYYVQMVNAGSGSQATVYNKSDGSVALGPIQIESLAAQSGTSCTEGAGDPIVLYDQLADRWLLSEFSDTADALCIYVSKTSDPITGGWYVYEFETPSFPDYPKYSVWPDAYYVTTNEINSPVYALERSQMLNGNSATMQRFISSDLNGFGFQALTPGDLDGAQAPPDGSPGYFMRHKDDEVHNFGPSDTTQDFLEIWELNIDWDNSDNSTFTGPTDIAVSEFDSSLCGLFSTSCFAQPNTGIRLDPLREIIMWRLQYRNFDTHETLVGNFVTDVDGTDHGGIRWFELRKDQGSSWTLFQEGTYAPDEAHRWLGSISMDKNGNIALGYSVTSSELNIFPSIRYVGRLVDDPTGTMPQGEITIASGTGPQTATTRWGDYSSMNIDPVDDRTIWYTNTYALANGRWQTRIASFKFQSSCASISPTSQSFGYNGGIGNVDITPSDVCDWTAVSNESWITIDSGSSGSGSGTVTYSVSSSTSARTGTITIAEQTFTVTQAGIDIYPDIQANSSDSTITINEGEQLTITISLSSGSNSGINADWWLAASMPSGEWQYYDLEQGNYVPGLSATHQGVLSDLNSFDIPIDTSSLDTGTYTYYFGIDINANGTLDTEEGQLYYDSVNIAVEAVEVSAPTGFTISASGSTLTLSWNAVSGAEGYYLYYGYSSGNYAGPFDLGNTTGQSFSSIPNGTYYSAVTAYVGPSESGYSNEASVTVDVQ